MKIKERIISCIRENSCIFAAFILPVVLMGMAFAAIGIYPFGDQQIAVIDMYHQYVPFLSELQSKLHDGGSLFYTWNGAAGSNFWTLIAYYGASPLNLLLFFFPESLVMEGITLILLIKIGLACSFMAIFLRYEYKVCDIATVAFATLYALSSYVMAYYWCIMWMDAVALLPLCIMGLHKLIDKGSFVQYTVVLALIVFINYYMAIMVCIFIMFYYPVLYFIRVKNGGVKKCARTTAKAVLFSLLAVAIAAVMLLPTYMSMQNTFYISAEMPKDLIFYNDPLNILNQLLPNAELTYREGLPNLYCGLVCVILFAFYVISKTIPLREKALNIGFLVFIFFSLNINKLDFIWHGFHFPNQLPYRYTFVVCFLLISIAYKTFLRIDEFSIKSLWQVVAVGVGYYLIAQKLLAENIDNGTLFIYGGIAWLVMYCVIFIAYKKGLTNRNLLLVLLLVVLVSEMVSNTCSSIDRVGSSARDSYFDNRNDMMMLVDSVKDDFARMETDDEYTLNGPALYHYRGISQFSSTVNADTTEFMERIGLEGSPGKNRFNYNQTAPVLNSILNVKYLLSRSTPISDETFTLVRKEGNSRLYENRYPLSIGYMVSDNIRTWNYHDDNPFTVLDDYVRAVSDNKYYGVFEKVGKPEILASNVSVTDGENEKIVCTLNDSTRESKVVLRYTAKKTRQYYVFVEADNASDIIVKKGESVDDIFIRNDCGSIVNIGEIKAGDKFDIEIDYKDGNAGDIRSSVRYMDMTAWNDVYDIISSDMMTVSEHTDTSISGSITAEKSGTCILSVPFEDGWSLSIDGNSQEITELVGNCFMAIHLDQGPHEIELSFRPPGIIAGLLMSMTATALLVICEVLRRGRQNRRSGKSKC